MRKVGSVFHVVLLALMLFGMATSAYAEKRVALLIGNNSYSNIPGLKAAVNDAHALGQVLKQLGFTVLIAENQSRRAMSETLLAFDRIVQPGDTAFFFFAGHGFEIRGNNYLLPTDVPAATDGQEELVRDSAFPVERIVDRLQARSARTVILVLDACRNNPFERKGTRGLAGAGGLAPMTPSEGVFIVFSAGAKQTALDGLGNTDANPNSVFTRNFARELSTPGLTLVQVAKRTQSDVKRMAASVRHEQTPAYYDQIVGDVVLLGSPGAIASYQPVPQLAPVPSNIPKQLTAKPDEPVNAPIASFSRNNSGWTVYFSFADSPTAISWRLGETGPFKETGFLDEFDPRTRKRMPNPMIELDADTRATTIFVRYIDAQGNPVGPFPIKFEPVAALERDYRKNLEMTSGSWLSFQKSNDNLYYSHLISYRCAIREARIGINSSMPDRKLIFPPCDQQNPNSIPGNTQTYMQVPSSTQLVSVELTYRDGSVSEVKTFRR